MWKVIRGRSSIYDGTGPLLWFFLSFLFPIFVLPFFWPFALVSPHSTGRTPTTIMPPFHLYLVFVFSFLSCAFLSFFGKWAEAPVLCFGESTGRTLTTMPPFQEKETFQHSQDHFTKLKSGCVQSNSLGVKLTCF